jgi:tetratricopeptide (TPR) repeat protein
MNTLSFRSLCLSLALIANASHSGAQSDPGYDAFIQQGNAQLQAGSTDQALNSGELAIKINADRWEGYALVGGALTNLKRYEDAADALSKAIERAPESRQPALRDLRRQCLLAESGYPAAANPSAADTTRQSEIVLWKSIESSHNNPDFAPQAQREDDRQHLVAKLTWTDPATSRMWARYSRHAEYAHASFTRASHYCSDLRLLGYADWRLPTAVELMGIYHLAADSATVHFSGGLAPNEEILRFMGFWTSTPGDKEGEHVLVFEGKSVSSRNDDGEGRVGGWFAGHSWNGAFVCVRDQKAAEHP